MTTKHRWTGARTLGNCVFFIALAASGPSAAQQEMSVDHATVNAQKIAKDWSIRVHLFDSSDADLGKPKHMDTARVLASTTPHLLAVDIVESLRDTGFGDVTLVESVSGTSDAQLNLTGRFTHLNPGSQAARAWIGFGAGESKVCIEGQVTDQDNAEIANFSHCRKGLGWGKSGGQLEASAERIGENVAVFFAQWAGD
jgi:hypothetical protein